MWGRLRHPRTLSGHGPGPGALPRRRAQPAFPALEQAVIERWRAEGTFQASIDQRAAEGADEFVFYDGPPFANGLPHYGHLLTGFVKDAVPRYQTMRGQAGRAPLRLGLPRPAGRDGGREGPRRLGPASPSRSTASARFNENCRSIVGSTADVWDGYVARQARWVDMEQRLQDHGPRLHGVGHVGVQAAPRQGPALRGLAGAPLLLGVRDAAVELRDPAGRRLPPAPGPGAHGAGSSSTSGEPRCSCGRRRRGRCRPTSPSPSGPTSTTRCYETRTAAPLRPRRGHRRQATPRSSRAPSRSAPSPGAELVGQRYTPLFPFFADTPRTPSVVLGRRLRRHRRGHRRRPHRARLRRGRPGGRARPPASRPSCPVDEHGRFTAEVPDYAGLQVFDANPRDHHAPSRTEGVVVRHETYDHSLPALLAHRHAAHLPGRVVAGSCKVTAIKDRMRRAQPADQLGARARPRRQLRQVARGRPRLVDQPQPLLGLADPGVEERRPRLPAHRRLRQPRRARARLRRAARPTCTARPSTSSPGPTPTTRPAGRRCGASPTCSTAGSSRARCRSPRCTTRSRTRDWFETHFPGDFIVEYIGQTRGWFYTLHVLATALFDRPAFQNCIAHGVLLGDDGQKLSKRLRNYPDPDRGVRHHRRRRHALVRSCRRPSLRGGDMVADRRADGGGGPPGRSCPIWNAWYFLTLYANADGYGADVPHRRPTTCSTATSSPRPASSSRRSPTGMDAYDLVGRLRRDRSPTSTRSTTGTSAARATASGPATSDAVDTLHTGARRALPGGGAAAAAAHRAPSGRRSPASASVHLADWPDADGCPPDAELVAAMDAVPRGVLGGVVGPQGRRASASGCRCASLTVAVARRRGAWRRSSTSSPTRSTSRRSSSPTTSPSAASSCSQLVPAVLGPRVGADVQKLHRRRARPATGHATADGGVEVARPRARPTTSSRCASCPDEGAGRARRCPATGGVVALDIEVTPELEAEGLARDLVRGRQRGPRATEGLHVSDRIRLVIDADTHHDVAERRRGPPRPRHGRGAGRRAGGGRQRQGPPPPHRRPPGRALRRPGHPPQHRPRRRLTVSPRAPASGGGRSRLVRAWPRTARCGGRGSPGAPRSGCGSGRRSGCGRPARRRRR